MSEIIYNEYRKIKIPSFKKNRILNDRKQNPLNDEFNQIYSNNAFYDYYAQNEYPEIINDNYYTYYINGSTPIFKNPESPFKSISFNKKKNMIRKPLRILDNAPKLNYHDNDRLFQDNKSFNSEILNTNKIFSNIFDNYIGKNVIHNTFNNFTNIHTYSTNTFKGRSNSNNIIHSINNIPNINPDLEDQNKNTTPYNIYSITNPNENFDRDNMFKANKNWNNSTYISLSKDMTVLNRNKQKILNRVNTSYGNTYIIKPMNNDNWKDNNSVYISNPNKPNVYYNNEVYNEPQIRTINLNDNQYTKVNNDIKNLQNSNNYNINIYKTADKPHKYNNQSIKFTSFQTENINLNSNIAIHTNSNEEMNYNRTDNNLTNSKNNNSYNIKYSSSNKMFKVKKIHKKKINLNLPQKNLFLLKGYKSFNSKTISSGKQNLMKYKKQIHDKINSFENSISINPKTINNSNEGYKKENQQSFSLGKSKNMLNTSLYYISKLKRECELCNQLIDYRFYKVHLLGHPTQIFKYLYLGNFANATNIKELKTLKINYILNCAIECHNNNLEKSFKELHLEVKDNENFNLFCYFEKSNEFINKCKLNGGACLVHCKLGISRSAAFVIAYLIKCLKFGAKEAFDFVKKKRMSIKPNDGFVKQLYEYERIIRKQDCH